MRSRCVRGVLVAMAALTIAGCQFHPTPWRPSAVPNGHGVGVVGDSLTWGAQTGGGFPDPAPSRLSDALDAAGDASSFFALIGFHTDLLADVDPWPQVPDIVVVALGTNDAHDSFVPLERYRSNIATFLDRTPAACDVLVNVNPTPTWGLDVTAPAYNQALVDLAASRPHAVVVDWASVAGAHPEYIGSDGVHQTEVGQAAYREAILGGVDACATLLDAAA